MINYEVMTKLIFLAENLYENFKKFQIYFYQK